MGYDFSFDAGDAPPPASELIPQAWYAATIEDIQKKDTKAGDGWYFSFRFRIDENRHPNIGPRILFAILNVGNANPTAVRIANEDMSRILHATGVRRIERNTDELIGHSLAIRIVIAPPKDGHDAKNEIKGYESIEGREKDLARPDGQPAQAQRTTTPANPSTGQPTGSKPSWRKS